MRTRRPFLLFFVLCALLVTSHRLSAQQYSPTWESIDSRPIPEWWLNAKFGIFIHWGLYSVPAYCPLPDNSTNLGDSYAEWYWHRLVSQKNDKSIALNQWQDKVYGKDFQYQDFVKDFNCQMFEPADWADLFEKSGAKYVVLTSKHHEGYTLWPSKYSPNWNAVDLQPHRDILNDLTEAVKEKGLHMGYYYSLLEWYNPLYKDNIDRYVSEHMIPQMKELVTQYQPEIVWTDGEWDYPSERLRSPEFLAWLYNDSPVKNSVVVNDRWGNETRSVHGGIHTTEYDLVHNGVERNLEHYHPWEESRGIGHSYGFNRAEKIEHYNTSKELVHMLIDKVSRGGNFLINVGPTADGRIPVIMQERLVDIGNWMAVNGEAIYDTRMWKAGSSQKDISAYFTVKGKDLYVICTKYPTKPIMIKGLDKNASKVEMLGTDMKIHSSNGKNSVTITAPSFTPDNVPCNYAWVFKVSSCIK